MDIIKKHKGAFIAIIIVALLITGIMGISMMAFMDVKIGSSVIKTELNENVEFIEDIYLNSDKVAPKDIKFKEPEFSEKGSAIYSLEENFKVVSSGGGTSIMMAYLKEGDTLNINFKTNQKLGEIYYSLYNEDGMKAQFEGSGNETITIDKEGNYVFEYYADRFKGDFEVKIVVKR